MLLYIKNIFWVDRWVYIGVSLIAVNWGGGRTQAGQKREEQDGSTEMPKQEEETGGHAWRGELIYVYGYHLLECLMGKDIHVHITEMGNFIWYWR